MKPLPNQTDFLLAVDDDSVAMGHAAHIPLALRDRGLNIAHRQPLVGIELASHDFRSFRVSPDRAWQFHRLEMNPAHSWAVLLFDCDRGDVDRPVPVPHWEVVNRRNGHFHAGYVLRNPVHRYKGARDKPQDYATAIEAGLIRLLGADAGYTGVLTRNPVDPGPDCETLWYARTDPYDLFELADWLDLGAESGKGQRQAGSPGGLLESYRVGCIGRNVYLHRWGIGKAFHLAHTNPLDRIESLMLEVLAEENRRRAMVSDFAKPLPDTEIRHIARSNARYVSTHYDKAKYSASQANKGRRGRESLTARLQEYNADRDRAIYDAYHVTRLRQADIARQFGLTQQAISLVLKKYKPGLSS